MRIIMLPKLIQQEETTELCLKDCNLVVDGHSFFYDAYENSKIPFVFGCDAKEFAKYIRVNKLLKFQRANVKCHFVFKGGDSDMAGKIQKIRTSTFDFETNYKFVPPIFMREVCLQMLDKTGVNYSTSIAEIFDDCVALAHTLQCPIVAYNLEYFLKGVPYIPVNTLKYSNPNNYITCKQYKIQDFLSKHSLTDRKLAIFITLSDINVFEQYYFNDLLKTWDVYDGNVYIQNKNVLKWLSEHDEDEVLRGISIFIIDEKENTKFFNQVEVVLNKIQYNNKWSIAAEYLFKNSRSSIMIPDPCWFEKGVASNIIAIPYVNLFKHKLIQGSTAIVKKNTFDSIMPAIDIIIYAYNLLTNFQTSKISIYQDADNIVEINTEDFDVKNPGYRCKESVFENGWDFIRDLKLFEHFLIENNLNVDIIHQIPLNTKILVITLAYYSCKKINAEIDVAKVANCFFIYLTILHKLRLYERPPISNHSITKDECNYITQIMEKYSKLEEGEEIAIFDGDNLNTLVEFQYCLLHMNYLNALCGTPFPPSRYETLVNCIFIYKLLHDMKDCDVDIFVKNLLVSSPSTFNSVRLFNEQFKRLLSFN